MYGRLRKGAFKYFNNSYFIRLRRTNEGVLQVQCGAQDISSLRPL